MEPPVSVPNAPKICRAATPAAEPPLEPPATLSVSQGLRVEVVGGEFRGGAHAEFVHVGLAQEHGPGFAQSFRHVGVVKGNEAFQYLGAAGGGHFLGRDVVLEGQGRAPQGLVRVGSGCVQGSGFFQCFLGAQMQEGLELGFRGLDASQTGLNRFLDRDFAFGQQVTDFRQCFQMEVGHVLFPYEGGWGHLFLFVLSAYTIFGTMKNCPSCSGALARISSLERIWRALSSL